MTFSVSLRAAALAAALSLPVAGAGFAQDAGPDAGKDPVVATVNGEDVKLSDLRTLYAALPARIRRLPFQRVYRPLLEQVIQMKLLSAQARKSGLDKSPAVQRELKSFEDRTLQQAYLRRHVDKTVTDEQLKESYDEYVKKFRGEEEVKARHILVKTREEAMKVVEALEKGGKFAGLAKQKSIGPSKAAGGDLGWFAKGQMVKPFADAAFALKKGRYSRTPVKTQFGWHVILLEDRRTKAPPTFDAMKERLKNQLGRNLAVEEIARLQAEARIVRFGPDGKPLDAGKPKKKEEKQDDKKQE